MQAFNTTIFGIIAVFSQNFSLTLERNSAHAGSTDLDCILQDPTLHILFYDLS